MLRPLPDFIILNAGELDLQETVWTFITCFYDLKKVTPQTEKKNPPSYTVQNVQNLGKKPW